MTDRACPLALIVFASFASVLVWVYALLQGMPVR
jgi:hypothetical protein